MRCAYRDCDNVQKSFSSLTFFLLPKDRDRRAIWADQSGNPEIKNCNTKRVFCELHFEEHHKQRQFTRTILHRDATPIRYQSKEPVSPDKHQNCLLVEDIDEPADITDSSSAICADLPNLQSWNNDG